MKGLLSLLPQRWNGDGVKSAPNINSTSLANLQHRWGGYVRGGTKSPSTTFTDIWVQVHAWSQDWGLRIFMCFSWILFILWGCLHIWSRGGWVTSRSSALWPESRASNEYSNIRIFPLPERIFVIRICTFPYSFDQFPLQMQGCSFKMTQIKS